jgi:hypothetical protein
MIGKAAPADWFLGAVLLLGRLDHDPENWKPVFSRDKREAFAEIMITMRFLVIAS